MLKSKVLFVVAGLILAGAFAQASQNQSPKIKKVREQIEFTEDVKVGSTVLKSGTYQVTSNDGQELTFRHVVPDPGYGGQFVIDTKSKPLVVKCSVTMLDAKRRGTLLEIDANNSGEHVLKSITLDDSNVKFTIGQ